MYLGVGLGMYLEVDLQGMYLEVDLEAQVNLSRNVLPS